VAEMEALNEVVQDCLEACTECELVCKEAVVHCLRLGGAQAEAEHVKLLLDCAEICSVSVSAMLRRSEFAERVCGLCADVCHRCAESCDQVADGDEWMADCAEVCRNCAGACRVMVGEEEIAA
jgi:hypothetical protein